MDTSKTKLWSKYSPDRRYPNSHMATIAQNNSGPCQAGSTFLHLQWGRHPLREDLDISLDFTPGYERPGQQLRVYQVLQYSWCLLFLTAKLWSKMVTLGFKYVQLGSGGPGLEPRSLDCKSHLPGERIKQYADHASGIITVRAAAQSRGKKHRKCPRYSGRHFSCPLGFRFTAWWLRAQTLE